MRVFPERSRSFDCVYMGIYAQDGLVELDRALLAESDRAKTLRSVFDDGFVPMPMP